MQLLPKRDKVNSSNIPRITKRHSRKIDIVLWVCCATIGLGSVLAAAAMGAALYYANGTLTDWYSAGLFARLGALGVLVGAAVGRERGG